MDKRVLESSRLLSFNVLFLPLYAITILIFMTGRQIMRDTVNSLENFLSHRFANTRKTWNETAKYCVYIAFNEERKYVFTECRKFCSLTHNATLKKILYPHGKWVCSWLVSVIQNKFPSSFAWIWALINLKRMK